LCDFSVESDNRAVTAAFLGFKKFGVELPDGCKSRLPADPVIQD
jgi:hypothetical protein